MQYSIFYTAGVSAFGNVHSCAVDVCANIPPGTTDNGPCK